MKTYLLDSRTVASHRAQRTLQASKVAPSRVPVGVHVIGIEAAYSETVKFALDSGYAVLIPKLKFHDYDLRSLRACLGHLGEVSPVFKYGKRFAVLIHKSVIPAHNVLQFAMRYPVDSCCAAGLKITDIVLVSDSGNFLSFSYRLNYLTTPLPESRLVSLEMAAR